MYFQRWLYCIDESFKSQIIEASLSNESFGPSIARESELVRISRDRRRLSRPAASYDFRRLEFMARMHENGGCLLLNLAEPAFVGV